MTFMFKMIHYCLQMCLKTLETRVLKYMNSIWLIFCSAPGLVWQACFKKAEVKLELLADVDMLLMIEKGIISAICHAIHRYAKTNNKHMKNYYKNTTLSYIMYLDGNNLYGWAMSQKLPASGFERVKKVI